MSPKALTPLPARALRTRLDRFLDDSIAQKVRNRDNDWPSGKNPAVGSSSFGAEMTDVRTIMVHATAGWPSRTKAETFFNRFVDKTADRYGHPAQFYIPHDGTVYWLIDLPRLTWHGNHTNEWSIGVETGNLLEGSPPKAPHKFKSGDWMPLDEASKEDVPGAKFYATVNGREVLVCLWTTKKGGFAGDPMSHDQMMLFSEAQYRSWALLARYLCESLEVPRNFALFPHKSRGDLVKDAAAFRSMLNADEMRDMYLREVLAKKPFKHTEAEFDDTEAFKKLYAGHVSTVTWKTKKDGKEETHKKSVNAVWTSFFDVYRGLHGHGFSGSLKSSDHDCPGQLFDWHRFARETWDYFWFPFDPATSAGPPARRDYGRKKEELREHYFDNVPAQYTLLTVNGQFGVDVESTPPQDIMAAEYRGSWHGGLHFVLAEGHPVYASANGELVAARFAKNVAGEPSKSFVLLRHEVFHETRSTGRVDYDVEPSIVYTLTMHLDTSGVTFDSISEKNPDWLNRMLVRKKECDLGLSFKQANPKAPDDAWDGAAPGRPKIWESWERDQKAIENALQTLRDGKVTVFPMGDTAIRAILGDYLGNAGALPDAPEQPAPRSATKAGIHFEVFSLDLLDLGFTGHDLGSTSPFYGPDTEKQIAAWLKKGFQSAGAYRLLAGAAKVPLLFKHAFRFKSEWALSAADFPAGAFSARADEMWWHTVAGLTIALAVVPQLGGFLKELVLPADGVVWHYHPLAFS
ncbi:MAG: N-acetylmuramoyl-L-alanine amidase [Polyangiaceae bacterium]